MDALWTFITADTAALAITLGYVGLAAVVFAESGLFFGFFFPGDSLLFTVGVLASAGIFNLPILLFIIPLAAILGDNVGYWFGAKLGPLLFERKDSFFFRKKHLIAAQRYYEKYGSSTIVLARFVPAVRTFAPIVAGAAKMPYKTFLRFNIIGGLLWGAGVPLLGYALGNTFPAVGENLLPIVSVFIALSFLPIIIEWLRLRRTQSVPRG